MTRSRRAPVEGHPHPLCSTGILVVVAVAVPVGRAAVNVTGFPAYTLVVAVAALVGALRLPRTAWAVRILVVGAAGLVVLLPEGRTTATMLVACLLLGTWAAVDRPPLPIAKPVPPGAAWIALAGAVAAGRSAQALGAAGRPVLILGATALVVLVVHLWPFPGIGVLSWAGSLLEFPLRYAVGATLAVLVASWGTVARWYVRPEVPAGWTRTDAPRSPLRPRKGPPIRWRPGGRATAAASILVVAALTPSGCSALASAEILPSWVPFTPDRGSFPSPNGVSAQRLGVSLPGDPVPPAFASASWYPAFRRDLAWVTDERVAWRPLAVQRVLDVSTTTVNVHDGARRSWIPPACDCRRVRVWLYGGSGAFGLGQRDGHTITSELARAAWRDGIALDVVNRGVPGSMHWRNATRFAWDLGEGPAPDLVVFYDGVEEVGGELALRRRGLGDTRAPMEAFVTDLYDEVVSAQDAGSEAMPGTQVVGWDELGPAPAAPGKLAASRYERSRAMSRAQAEVAGVPARYFWQPSQYDAQNSGASTGTDDDLRVTYAGAAAALAPDVVPLAPALDRLRGPLFVDDGTHNEVAARALGERMWAELRTQVAEVAGR